MSAAIHCSSLAGTVDTSNAGFSLPLTEFQPTTHSLRKEPPSLAYFFASVSNNTSSKVIKPHKDTFICFPSVYLHRSTENSDCLSITTEELEHEQFRVGRQCLPQSVGGEDPPDALCIATGTAGPSPCPR
jgi:hypothetical protein